MSNIDNNSSLRKSDSHAKEKAWVACFESASVLTAHELQYRVFRLSHWPTIAYLPIELQPVVARICALLARRPTNAALIPQLLGIECALVLRVLEMLHRKGYLEALHANLAGSCHEPVSPIQGTPIDPASPAIQTTLLRKIWSRLTRGGAK